VEKPTKKVEAAYFITLLAIWAYCAVRIFSRFYLDLDYFESDFVDYCIGILHFDDLSLGIHQSEAA